MNYVCSYTAFLLLLFVETASQSEDTNEMSNQTVRPRGKSLDLFEGTEGIVNILIMLYIVGMYHKNIQCIVHF